MSYEKCKDQKTKIKTAESPLRGDNFHNFKFCTLIFYLSLVLLLAGAGAAFADVKLPAVIGDNMVLQQGGKISIWGWADPGEEVMAGVSWHSMKWAVTADKDGKWAFKMNPPKAGGPYEMTISGKNVIEIKNIMVGEVWVWAVGANAALKRCRAFPPWLTSSDENCTKSLTCRSV